MKSVKSVKAVNQDKPFNLKGRRQFLQKSVMMGAGVATTVSIPAQVLASVEKPTEVKPKKDEGYRVTKHIADYYKSTQL